MVPMAVQLNKIYKIGGIKMSYKKGIDKVLEMLREEEPKGNDITLLAKIYDDYYELSESIVCVEDIEPGETAKDISTLKLRFARDEVIETKAFVDKTIQKGTIISIIGCYNGLFYSAKGGLMPIITKATDVTNFSLTKCQRMGPVTGLSELKIANKYPDLCSIKPLGKTGLYYRISNYPKPASPVNKLGLVDTTSTVQTINTSAFADMEDDTEDYPDYPDPVSEKQATEEIKENEE